MKFELDRPSERFLQGLSNKTKISSIVVNPWEWMVFVSRLILIRPHSLPIITGFRLVSIFFHCHCWIRKIILHMPAKYYPGSDYGGQNRRFSRFSDSTFFSFFLPTSVRNTWYHNWIPLSLVYFCNLIPAVKSPTDFLSNEPWVYCRFRLFPLSSER